MSKLNRGILAKIAVTLILLALSIGDCYSQGNLLITPRRIVFDGSRRVVDLNLANTGQDSATYNVSLIQYRMNEDGSFTEITEPDPGQKFADKNIRFYPRSVTLGPSEAQVVKMQVVNSDKLMPGEYRSHIYFRSVPKQVAMGEDDSERDSTAVNIKLIPIFGITIPVIIKVGNDDTKVNISDLKFVNINDTTDRVELTFIRSGAMSAYGDLKIIHVSTTGKETNIGAINGIAIYTPNLTRKLKMDLDKKSGSRYTSGKIKAVFVSQSDSKPVTYAETEISLN